MQILPLDGTDGIYNDGRIYFYMLILHKTVHAYERKEVQNMKTKTILASTSFLAMIAGANSAHAEVNDATLSKVREID